MKIYSTMMKSLVLAAAMVGGSAALAGDYGRAGVGAKTATTAHRAQLAASGNRLSGPQIRSLISGHTAQMQRRRANKSISIALSFGADGSVRHTCTAQSVNVGAHGAPQCRTPSASGNWAIRGNKLCVTVGKRRCYFVIRAGGGHVFRSPSGKGRPYAGRISVR